MELIIKFWPLIRKLMFFVLGLMFVVTSLQAFTPTMFLLFGEKAQAKIVSVKGRTEVEQHTVEKKNKVSKAVVSKKNYTTESRYFDHKAVFGFNGKQYETKFSFEGNTTYHAGDVVGVLFNPDRPEKSVINKPWFLYKDALGSLLSAVLFLITILTLNKWINQLPVNKS